jgi:hypothetical protein
VAVRAKGVLSQGVLNPSGFGEFELTPLQAGVLERDSGTITSVWRRVVVREGQRLETYDAVTTLKGSRRSLVFRERVEWVDAGDGYHPGPRHLEGRARNRPVRPCHRRRAERQRVTRSRADERSSMYPQVTQFETRALALHDELRLLRERHSSAPRRERSPEAWRKLFTFAQQRRASARS